MSITEQILASDIGHILKEALQGRRPSEDDCLMLLESGDIHMIGRLPASSPEGGSARLPHTSTTSYSTTPTSA